MPIAKLTLAKSTSPIEASPLTPAAFEKFGSVVSSYEQLQTMQNIPANYGTATKLSKVSAFTNNFAHAPSGQPATTNVNLFRSSFPFKLMKRTGVYDGEYSSGVLERHPFSTQTFLPMGCLAEDVSYLVIVAEKSADGLPDLNTVKAFVAKGNQAVTYSAGTWHAPMVSLKEVIDFAVLINENGVADEDCQEVYINPRLPIIFSTNRSTSESRL
ncbi:ureidoglycolate hydrolase [Lipomyces arxii]|uniref:ureidoglycolate hydrolase n=1 Tax=Lipomyces arxii TaxID=56418 RepID=UPI0034CFB8AB